MSFDLRSSEDKTVCQTHEKRKEKGILGEPVPSGDALCSYLHDRGLLAPLEVFTLLFSCMFRALAIIFASTGDLQSEKSMRG